MTKSSDYNENFPPDNMRDTTLPGGLSALTILTIVGSILFLLLSVFGYFNSKTNYDKKDEVMAQMNSDKVPGFVKSIMPDTASYDQLITKSYENRVPLLLIGVVSCILCLVGAIQMRKRKKQGFTLYLIGELLPFVSSAIFIGMVAFSGLAFYIPTFIALIFIILYASQRKHLIY